MASKKTAAVQTAPNANAKPARNVENNAVAVPEQTARQIEGFAKKTGMKEDVILRRVLELGMIRASEIMDGTGDKPAKTRKAAAPNELDERLKATRKAAKEAKAEKWRVRNQEIDIALTDLRDKDSMEVFSALTPANGKWILRTMEETLREIGLFAGDGQYGFMLDWRFPPAAFKSKLALRRAMNNRMDCDKCRGGDFMAERADTLAVYIAEGFKGDFKKSRLLAVAAESYRNAETCHREKMAQARESKPAA